MTDDTLQVEGVGVTVNTEFSTKELTLSFAALTGITPRARELIEAIGVTYPDLPDTLFDAVKHDLAGTGVTDPKLRDLLPIAELFRPMVVAVVQRMFRCRIAEADFEEIRENAVRLESFDLAPEVQFAVYANIHLNCSRFMRQVLSPVDADEVITAMASFWMLTGALFTTAYIDARQRRESALVEETTRLAFESGLDPLTRLKNRSTLNHVQREMTADEQFGLIFVDLDRFKVINDTYGHVVGDALLCHVAKRIASNARDCDLAVRFGGDEFLVLTRDTEPGGAEVMARRILESLAQPFHVDGFTIGISASIGVSTRGPAEDMQDAVARADKAAYDAKRAGGALVVSF